jgi:diacylglycerol kinase family enzyme
MTELPMDVLALADGTVAVNMVVLGTSPERLGRFARRTELRIRADNRIWFNDECTTVVLAVGQWLHGIDLVPRGHPGDGRVEIQAYRLRPSERRAMRRRLAAGAHLPHPRIPTRSARRIEVEATAPVPLEVDGVTQEPVRRFTAEVRADAYRLLV